MLRNVANTVTGKVSSTYSALFVKSTPHHQFIQLFTRFSSAAEMHGVAEALEKLNDKKYSMKKLADEKGVQSDEFKTYNILNRILEESGRLISDFNQLPIKDYYSSMQDLHALTTRFHELVVVTEEDKQALNSVALDKPIAKNAAVTSAIFAVPAIPMSLLFGPIGTIICVAGGALLSRSANDYLTANHIISWDTESKDLVLEFAV